MSDPLSDNLRIQLDLLGFEPEFSVDYGPVAPDRSPTIQVQRNAELPMRGPTIRITPLVGPPWSLNVQEGTSYLSLAVCGPTQNHLCVVAHGTGYVVPVDNPTQYRSVEIEPVVEIRRVPGRNVVLFVGFSDVAAYGASGQLWIATDVAQDGIVFDDITDGTVRGHGDGSDLEMLPSFSIDVDSGRVQMLNYVRAGRGRNEGA